MSSVYAPPPAPQPKKKLYERKGFWIGVGAFVAIGVIGNALDGGDSSTDAKPEPAVTVTETATPATPAAPVSPAKEEEPSAPAVEEPAKEARTPATEEEPAVVPNVVGMNHADAMDVLHTAGFMVDENSVSPGNTFIIANSNWKVCSQDPAAGATDVLRVTINSVKLAETC
ncbi:PASTA domain-containing protein [Streptomyces sp. NPDC054844]